MGWRSSKSGSTQQGVVVRGFKPAPPTRVAEDPVEAALQLGRYGVLVGAADELRKHKQYSKAVTAAAQAIDAQFALVPEGSATIPLHVNDQPGSPGQDVETGSFLLARHAVTNAEYQLFVDGGAYDDHELWSEAVWPHLISFRDQTGTPGPRYWCNGRHDRRLSRYPVVGICWYEAAAYVAWAGYRLPSEAEWQVAATWQLGAVATSARRYPWGDTLDLECCNIWASGHGRTLSVDACPAGAAPNGILQLVGNTWEWVESDFDCTDDQDRRIVGESLMKGIRGGAFDTYFAWQATGSFRTGLPCLARAGNVGFRCALDLVQEQ